MNEEPEEPDEESGRGGDEPPRFGFEDIQKLVDAAQYVFGKLYDYEQAYKQSLKRRMLAAMQPDNDLVGPGEHYRSHEDYVPNEQPEADS